MNKTREEQLFQQALAQPVAERAAFLERECDGDAALRSRLEALLSADAQTNGVLATTPDLVRPTVLLDPDEMLDDAVGKVIGRYKLLEKLGEGGCGVVYVAEQTEPVRRRVALKLIKPGMDSRAVIARFEAERQALALMDHPNIAKVLDAGTTGEAGSQISNLRSQIPSGRPYFVMELVRGIRITDYCDQDRLSVAERLDLFIKVCQAIQHAHQKGIIHRDIKPSNILVTLHDGVPVPKVIDFGIAKATEGRLTDATVYTQLHQFIGTPAYMSPEQAEMSGLDIDTRSDIYSLGVLLYELLTGVTPFDTQELLGSGLDGMRKMIREKEPVRPSTRLTQIQARTRDARLVTRHSSLPTDLDWIVMKCLEKDRARRYETANGLAADLKRHLSSEAVIARPPSAAYRFQKAVRRNKLLFATGAAVALALILGCGLATFAFLRERAWRQALIESDHGRVVERVRYAIQSGVRERTEQALKDAEAAQLGEAQLRFLRGLHFVTTAQAERAIPELTKVRELEPDNVAALGLLAWARGDAFGGREVERLLPELERARPKTSEDRLFLGQAFSFIKPKVGLPLMEEAIRVEDSPMGRILVAGVKVIVATEDGDLALMRAALDDISAAEAWARNSLPILIASCHAHRAASELYRRAGDLVMAQTEAKASEAANQRLESFYPNVQAITASLDHLILTGQIDRALDLARQWSEVFPGSRFELHIAWVLLLKGEFETYLKQPNPAGNDPLVKLARFLAAIEMPDHRQEAEALLAEASSSSPARLDDLFTAIAMNLLSGRSHQAQVLAREFLQRTSLSGLFLPRGHTRIVQFFAGQLSEESLLEEATGTQTVAATHHFVALHHLAQGRRAKMRHHLELSRSSGVNGGPAQQISILLLKRFEQNPNWPPTIPVSENTSTREATNP